MYVCTPCKQAEQAVHRDRSLGRQILLPGKSVAPAASRQRSEVVLVLFTAG